jgi:hypothetical protein
MNPAEMLALAAIGYRGCELNLSQARILSDYLRCAKTGGLDGGEQSIRTLDGLSGTQHRSHSLAEIVSLALRKS